MNTSIAPELITYSYTPDMTRPMCPECGRQVEMPVDVADPETAWQGTCGGGHTALYELDCEDWDDEDDGSRIGAGHPYRKLHQSSENKAETLV